MLQQNSYATYYAKAGITPERLRNKASAMLALADLLEMAQLPMDPLDILSIEDTGHVVDLETGAISQAVQHDA